jgi:hypothetical protein
MLAGLVNLLLADALIRPKGVGSRPDRCLRGSFPCDFSPDLEALDHLLSVGSSREAVASRAKVLHDRSIRGKETLGVTRRLEALHTPLPLPRGLMRVFRAVVQIAMLPMFHTEQRLALGGAIAFQLVCDKYPWHVRQAFEQLAEELFSRVLIPPTLQPSS